MKKTLIWIGCGSLIFLFGFFSGSFWATVKFFNAFERKTPVFESGKKTLRSEDFESMFYEALFWGGQYRPTEELAPLPPGDGTLKVVFNYDQKPAVGVGFELALNGRYRTEKLVSDTDGSAGISLPWGTWHLNRLSCESWPSRPQGDFLLVSGDEARLGPTPYHELFFRIGDVGKTIELDKAQNPDQTLRIEIRDRIKILWPGPGEPKQNATIDGSAIKWEPYPGAASYVLKISRVTRERPRTTTYDPIIFKKVDGADSLALAQLPHTQSDAAHEEYALALRAYDQDGAFLSESEHNFSTFSLTDRHVLVEYDESESLPLEQSDIDRQYQTRQALEAAALLIGEALFEEARALLEKTDATALPEQAALVKGYLQAAQGRCGEARRFFDQAMELGQRCIPEKYRAACGPN